MRKILFFIIGFLFPLAKMMPAQAVVVAEAGLGPTPTPSALLARLKEFTESPMKKESVDTVLFG
ncbi:hypothetical protein, partial [Citrobacter freundii]|uniref:hypothetical protein n=1 Tax=Citrobacter freundii TaxID=546 RepID=UPI001C43549E